jgi:hypothetical protein
MHKPSIIANVKHQDTIWPVVRAAPVTATPTRGRTMAGQHHAPINAGMLNRRVKAEHTSARRSSGASSLMTCLFHKLPGHVPSRSRSSSLMLSMTEISNSGSLRSAVMGWDAQHSGLSRKKTKNRFLMANIFTRFTILPVESTRTDFHPANTMSCTMLVRLAEYHQIKFASDCQMRTPKSH